MRQSFFIPNTPVDDNSIESDRFGGASHQIAQIATFGVTFAGHDMHIAWHALINGDMNGKIVAIFRIHGAGGSYQNLITVQRHQTGIHATISFNPQTLHPIAQLSRAQFLHPVNDGLWN